MTYSFMLKFVAYSVLDIALGKKTFVSVEINLFTIKVCWFEKK